MEIRRYNVERSCLRCHQRKVRCDKCAPCGTCARQNVVCQYPGSNRVKRRPPKANSTDLLARVQQLEQLVAELTRSGRPGSTSRASAEDTAEDDRETERPVEVDVPQVVTPDSPNHQAPREGLLVRDGRYINEHLLSRFLAHDKELQTVITTPRNDETGPGRRSPLRVEGLVTNPLLAHTDIETLRPGRWQATQLWQIFLSRVDPVVKILHIPSTEPKVFAAINRPEEAPADVHPLLFAIYFAATTALISDDASREDIRADLRRYKTGFEIALYTSSFLDAPTVTSLQAIAIYQACLRYHNSGRSSWMLHGLTVRAAQSIGLHRDGKNFNLPPLECELRRRLWWHITTFDHRAAEDHGLYIVAQNEVCDTCLPSNLDDQDISPTATHPPLQRPRWTEMSSPLIATETNRCMHEVSRQASLGVCPDKLAQELRDRIHKQYIRHGDPDIPIHRHGMLLGDVLATKVAVYARQKALQSRTQNADQGGVGVGDHETLEMAVYALERGLEMQTDELLRGFRWLTSTYTQYHLLTYILWHLCMHPAGPHVERAWRSVDLTCELVEKDPCWPDPGPKWAMVSLLRAKARKMRDATVPAESCEMVVPEGDGLEALLDLGGWDINMLGFGEWSGGV